MRCSGSRTARKAGAGAMALALLALAAVAGAQVGSDLYPTRCVAVVDPCDVTVTLDPLRSGIDERVEYTLTLTHDAGSTDRICQVDFTLAPSFVDVEPVEAPSGWTVSAHGRSLTWEAPYTKCLRPGGVFVFRFAADSPGGQGSPGWYQHEWSFVTSKDQTCDGYFNFLVGDETPPPTPETGPAVLDLQLVPTQATVVPGGELTYLATLANIGGRPAAEVTVRLPLVPAGLTLTGWNADEQVAQIATDPLSFGIDTLAVSQAKEIALHFSVALDPGALNDPVTATMTAAGTDPEAGAIAATPATALTPVTIPSTGLIVYPLCSEGLVLPGAQVVYQIIVVNRGDQQLFNVDVADELPEGFSLIRAQLPPDVAYLSGPPPTYRIPQLDPGASRIFSLVWEVTGDAEVLADPVENRVSGTALDQAGNPVLASPQTLSLPLARPGTGLALRLSALTPVVTPGEPVGFLLDVVNPGDGDLTQVRVIATAPEGFTLRDANFGPSVTQLSADPPTFLIARLPARTCCEPIGLTYATAGGASYPPEVTHTASASALGPFGESVAAEDVAVTLPVVASRGSAIQVGKINTQPRLVAGTETTYIITVSNRGDQDLHDVLVTDSRAHNLSTIVFEQTNPDIINLHTDPPSFRIPSLPVHAEELIAITFRVVYDPNVGWIWVQNEAQASGIDEDGRVVADSVESLMPLVQPVVTLDVSKVATQAEVIPGGTVTYLLTVANSGQLDLTDVTITDTLPPGLTYAASNLPPGMTLVSTYPPTFRQPLLKPGAFRIVSLTCNASSDPADFVEPVHNVVNAYGFDPALRRINAPPDAADLPLAVETEVARALDVEKVATTDHLEPGGAVTYLVTLTNTGHELLYNLQVSDIVPAGMTLARAELDDDVTQLPGDPPTFAVDSLLSHESTMLALIFQVSGDPAALADTLVNEARAFGYAADEALVEAEPDFSALPVVPRSGSIDIEKTAIESPFPAGALGHYLITVTNTSAVTLSQVTVTDVLTAGLTFVDAEPAPVEAPPGSLTWTLDDLAPGASHTIILTVGVDYALHQQDVTNTAAVTAATPSQLPVSDADATTTPCQAAASSIHLDKLANDTRLVLGGQVSYHLLVSNDGGLPLEKVTLRDPIPDGLSFVQADYDPAMMQLVSTDPVVTLQFLQPLDPTASEAITLFFNASRAYDDYHLAPGDSTVVNEADVVGIDPKAERVKDEDAADLQLVVPRPSIQVRYAHTTGEIVPGERTTYLATVENTGDQVLTDVVLAVADLAGQGLLFEDANFDAANVAENHGGGFHRWELLTPLAPNASEEVRITYQVTNDISGLPDVVASVASASGLDEAGDPVGDSATEEVPLSPKRGAVGIDNTAAQGAIYPGELVTYVLTINAGPELDLTDLRVTAEDLTAQGLTYYESTYDTAVFAPDGDLAWEARDTIPAGALEQIRVTYRANADAAALPLTVTMNATADGHDRYGRAVGDADEETLAVLLHQPHLLLEKVALATALVPGEPLMYLITATNNGDAALYELTITDALPEVLTTSDSYFDVPGLTFDPDPQTPRWQLDHALEPGEAVAVKLLVTSDPDPTHYGETVVDLAQAEAVDGSGGAVAAEATDILPVHTPTVAVDVTKVPNQNVVEPGGTVSYTLHVHNVGRTELSRTRVTEDLPGGLAYRTSYFDASQVTLTGTTPEVTWEIGALAPGSGVDIQVYFDASVDPTDFTNPVTNTVIAEAYGPGDVIASDLARASLPVQQREPDIRIEKRATTSVARTGERLEYTLYVTNSGNSTLSGVAVTDTLAHGLSYEGSRYDGDLIAETGTAPNLRWDLLGEMIPGEQRRIFLTARVAYQADSVSNPLVNTAHVVGTAPGGATVSAEATEALPLRQAGPRVTIQKFTNAPVVRAGEEILYTVQITNTGDSDIVKAYIREELPLGLAYVSSVYDPSVISGPGNAREPIWAVNALPLQATETITVRLRAETDRRAITDPVVNVARIEAWDASGAHFSDSDFEETPLAEITPAIHVDALATTGAAVPGEPLTFLISLTNTGDQDLFQVAVRDTLPAGLTIASTDYDPLHVAETRGTAPDGRETITWELTQLPTGGHEQMRLSCAVTENPGVLGDEVELIFHATAVNGATEAVADSDGDRLPVAATGSAIDLAKTALEPEIVPGTYVSYMLTVRNAGRGPLHDARVVDTIPAGLTFDQTDFNNTVMSFAGVAGDTAVWVIPQLAVGAYEQIRVTYLAASSLIGNVAADTLASDATVTAYDAGGAVRTDTDGEALPIHPQRAGIQLLKWADAVGGAATRGAEIAYHIQVVDIGDQDLAPVSVIDYMPAGLRFLEADVTPDSVVTAERETRIYWSRDVLHPVESWEVLVRARIDTLLVDGQTLENRATAIGIDERGNEVRSSDISRVLAGLPVLQIEKTVSRPIARPGERVAYTVTYRNSGTADAENVVVMDALPEHLTYVAGSATGGAFYESSSNTVTRTVNRLEIDRGAIFSYEVALDAAVPLGMRIPNTAIVYADGMSAAESDTAWITVADAAAALLKTVDRTVAIVGDTLTYTLSYQNLSENDYARVELRDPVPSEVDYLAGSGGPDAVYDPGTRNLTWSRGALEAGHVGNVSFQARVRPEAAAIGRVTNDAAMTADGEVFASNAVVTLVVEDVGVALGKRVDRDLAMPGDTLSYTLVARNLGPSPLTAIRVTDPVPPELGYIPEPSGSVQRPLTPEYDASDRILTWEIGVIGPGESVTLGFRARVNDGVPSGTRVANLATIETHETLPVVSNPAFTLIQYPDLLVTKTADRSEIVVGEEVVFTVTVQNRADGPTDSTWVRDTVPHGFDYVTGSTLMQRDGEILSTADPGAAGDPVVLTWDLGRLGAYATVTLSYRMRATGEAGPGMHDNQVVACGVTQSGETLCTEPVVATVGVVVPSLTLTKTTYERSVDLGDPVLYRITLRNNTAAPVHDLEIRDHLPVGFRFLPGSGVLNGAGVADPELIHEGEITPAILGPIPVERGRDMLVWPIGELAGGADLTLTYYTVVGLNASSGVAWNRAEAVGLDAGMGIVVAGPAEARVFVLEDELPSRLRGRVIVDCDGDGRPDQPLPRRLSFSAAGMPVDEWGNVAGSQTMEASGASGVMIRVEDGRGVRTDEHGEFFLYPLEYGDHAAYLDPRSLEEGTRILSEDSEFFTVLEGGEARLEFRICPPPPKQGSLQVSKGVAPAEVMAVKRVLEPEVYLIEGILFDTGQATLRPEAGRVLDEAAQRLREDLTANASIEGHTDVRPIHTAEFTDNYVLSDARAKVVRDALVGRGIDAGRMTTRGFGPDRPLAPNTTARNLSLNRRTEVIVLPSTDSLTTAALFTPSEVTFTLRLVYEGDFPGDEGALRDATVFDALPHGLEYRLGSTTLDGQAANDPELVPGEGREGRPERWLKWDLGVLRPGRVGVLAYRAVITDLPEVPAGGGIGRAAPERPVAAVDSLLRREDYRNGRHLWENRAWFRAAHRDGAIQTDPVGADLQLAFERTQKPVRITIDDVLFDTGQATLRPEAFGVLNPAADLIRERVGWKVRIEGHCDIRPIHTRGFPSNQELSDARAQAVRDYLVNVEQLDPALFKLRGFGERRPIADNETEAGRQKNRRVEIVVYSDEVKETDFKPVPPGRYPGEVRLDLR